MRWVVALVCAMLALPAAGAIIGPLTYTVTNTGDSGAGSLRQAILNANAHDEGLPGARDTIAFDLPINPMLPLPPTLAPASALPAITDPVIIDATTQPLANRVQLDGTNAGSDADGLLIQSGNCLVRGLIINRFDGNGLHIVAAGGNVVENCWIGVNLLGVGGLGNSRSGVFIDGSPSNTVGTSIEDGMRNVISGNTFNGVRVEGASATGNVIAGNYIGLGNDGASPIGNSSHGVFLVSAGNRVGDFGQSRNVISANGASGVRIDGDGNAVQGNYVGTDATGTVALGNFTAGISVGGANNMIGGLPVSGERRGNLVSGGGYFGISVEGQGNVIQGNVVGLDLTLTADLGNSEAGIYVTGSDNLIGGREAGARNIVSGNDATGILVNGIQGPGSQNRIEGNWIGLDGGGSLPVPNTLAGVWIDSGTGNVVGGASPEARNLIAGHGEGIHVQSATGVAEDNRIEGNWIGLSDAGNPVPNVVGVTLLAVSGVTIGGLTPVPGTAPGNVISGNGVGVKIDSLPGMPATGNQIVGNLIGLDPTGQNRRRNTGGGVVLSGTAANLIGGSSPQARNVISGNDESGILITGASASQEVVRGNFIGLDITGGEEIRNEMEGIRIDGARGCRIENNVISGNEFGVGLHAGATANVLAGNLIGLDASGESAVPNMETGVLVDAAHANVIGGTGPGEGNVISGNNIHGIEVRGMSASNEIIGNRIGTDPTGMAAMGNGADGISVFEGIGTLIGGSGPREGNLISGNGNSGVNIQNTANAATRIAGNWIGTDATGTNAIPNGEVGVRMAQTQLNEVGTIEPGGGNVIAGSPIGILLSGGGTSLNSIRGNLIGTGATGTSALPNGQGVLVVNAAGNLIGGSTPGERNVIAGNTAQGIELRGSFAEFNTVIGNFIGVDATGSAPLGNGQQGVLVSDAPRNLIGLPVSAAGNVISGNGASGVQLTGAQATGNRIRANLIGTLPDGQTPAGNGADGVAVTGAADNVIGGAPSDGNLIAFNGSDGVFVGSGAGNAIRGNAIHSNLGLAVDLFPNGVSGNDADDSDTGANQLQNFPVLSAAEASGNALRVTGALTGSPEQTLVVELFANAACDPSMHGEAQQFLASAEVITDPAGHGIFEILVASATLPGRQLSATATDAAGNTSELSACLLADLLPSVEEIIAYLLGSTSDPTGLNLNGDGQVDAADIVERLERGN